MINDINNILLIKYLRNELSESEQDAILQWVEEKDENKEFLFGLKEAYQLSKWKEFKIRADAASGWEDLNERIDQLSEQQPRKLNTKKWWYYAAAAIVLLFVGFGLRDLVNTDKVTFNTIETYSGQQSTLLLNDGTKVNLNQNSKLIYPTSFNGANRNVRLQGEAYFEVAHNTRHPFQVDIGTYTVRVLGTKFNIDAYPDQIYVYTSLKEGRIQIIDNSKDAKVLSELKPGMQLSYNRRTGEYFVKTIDTGQITDWANGEMVIKRQTLEEVAQRLEQKYGYSIQIQDHRINKLTYSITIDKEPLEEILSNIHFITPQVNYSINNSTKTVILR
jgi:ferric-dicitrate binding protein FerR (iron transport regulator)